MSEVDQNLYSRQIYVMGLDAQKKLNASSVLISGMGGVGVEIAKNVILAGVKNVTIQDTKNATINDLASNFYIKESNIGQNRAAVSMTPLANLNKYVSVSLLTEGLNNEAILAHKVLVLTEMKPEEEIRSISKLCHENGVKLIIADARGLFCFVFTDFGENFIIRDPLGNEPVRFKVTNITNHRLGVVSAARGTRHGLEKGDRVRFEGVEGMTEVNGKTFPVRIHDDRHIIIGDTTKFGKFENTRNTAVAIQVFSHKKVSYLPFEEAVKAKKYEIFDFFDTESHGMTLLLFLALSKLGAKSDVTADQIISAASEINSELSLVDTISEHTVNAFVRTLNYVISPMASIAGGFAGQEVLKAITGKFTPLNQLLVFHYLNCVRDTAAQFTARGDRYDAFRAVFGDSQQSVMEGLNYFMIGAGALGCELLKNFALMGVATDENSKVVVTDMDRIEVSNLSRQFLFHDGDVGGLKSEVAAKAVKAMNPAINIEARSDRLSEETRSIYNDDFYKGLSGVANALDNIPTRRFSDSLAVHYGVPMIDSGTLGPKAHFQVVSPGRTEDYSSQEDPQEEQIPMCTLHMYHRNIDHCTLWALDAFTSLFDDGAEVVNKFITDDNFATNTETLLKSLRTVRELLLDRRPSDFVDCVKEARGMFDRMFNHDIRDIIALTPPQKWADESLKIPEPTVFDASDEDHIAFIGAAARLLADMYCIPIVPADIPAIAKETPPAEYVPGAVASGKSDADLDEDTDKMLEELKPLRQLPLLKAAKFEKDDDGNGHIDFIAAAANVRARCFNIGTAKKIEIKRIAGHITPAIATTTAMICGFVCLEMYKVHAAGGPLQAYSGNVNLADDGIVIFEASSPTRFEVRTTGEKFTVWDKWVFESSMSVAALVGEIEGRTKALVNTIACGDRLLYLDSQKGSPSLERPLSEAMAELGFMRTPGVALSPLRVLVATEDDEQVYTPSIYVSVK